MQGRVVTLATLIATVCISLAQLGLPNVIDDWFETIGIGDSTAPVTTITSAPGGTDQSTTVTFNWSVNESATHYCSLNGSTPTVCTSGKQYTTGGTPPLTDAVNTFVVYGVDSSNNREDSRVHIWNRGGSTAYTCPSGATNIDNVANPSVDADSLINAQNSDGGAKDVFCVKDSATEYTISPKITLGANDEIIGEYSDQTRPILNGGAVPQTIFTSNANGAVIKNIAVTGAQFIDSTTCGTTNALAWCGRGIGGGGQNVVVQNVRAYDNENQGMGGFQSNFVGDGLILENNGWSENFNASATTESAAGFKQSNYSFTITNSVVRENGWQGIWCDIECGRMTLDNVIIEDNFKAGVSDEISPTATETGSCPVWSEVKNSTIRGNGWGASIRQDAEILIQSSSCLRVTGNVFGDTNNHLNYNHTNGANFNAEGRVYAVFFLHDPARLPGIKQGSIDVSNNVENADQYKCYDADLSWAPSSSNPWPCS